MLVNNAGILRDRMLVNMDEADWDAVIKVHLKGTFAPVAPRRRLLARPSEEAGASRRRPHHQHVVGRRASTATSGQTNYGAAKAGIAAFTIIAARELERYGVTVNAIAPQALTRMTEGLARAHAGRDRHRAIRAGLRRSWCGLPAPKALASPGG